MNKQGINYKITGEARRGEVCHYHHKPYPLFLNKTPYSIDISGLKKAEQRTAILIDGNEYASRFTIGFEIEKNQLHRNAVREYELFCGFERDGSCGYEAVTHILPLLPNGKWKTKVFDMMLKAEKIIDDRYSPSDKRCGGHITIACEGMDGDDVLQAVRKNSGIILAMFRRRLKNAYCGSNRRLEKRGEPFYNSHSCGSYGRFERHSKYQTALVKSNCLEFRIPSKFESVKQMMRRYELFYELMNYSINKPNGSYSGFIKVIKPIIMSMYNGDEAKANEVIELSKSFQKFINTGAISDDISEFLN